MFLFYSATQRDFIRKYKRSTLRHCHIENTNGLSCRFLGFPMELQDVMGWRISPSGSFLAILRTVKEENKPKHYVEVSFR